MTAASYTAEGRAFLNRLLEMLPSRERGCVTITMDADGPAAGQWRVLWAWDRAPGGRMLSYGARFDDRLLAQAIDGADVLDQTLANIKRAMALGHENPDSLPTNQRIP